MQIAVLNKSFRLPFGETLRLANLMGFENLQIALEGEFDVDSMSREKTAVMFKMLEEHNMSVCSYCGDLGGHGFTDPKLNAYKIPKTLKMVDYAHNTGVGIITTHIGVIPVDRLSKTYSVLSSALSIVGEYAAKCGITIAVETGPENPRVLAEFIDRMPSSIRVNMDPANLVMVTGDDPAKAVKTLGWRIVHTHATDGKRFGVADPNSVCGSGGAVYDTPPFAECSIGKGDVNWKEYLTALKKIDYDGFLTIECDCCNDPLSAISEGKKFLEQTLIKL